MNDVKFVFCKNKSSFFIVDAEDFEEVSKRNWTLNKKGYAHTKTLGKHEKVHGLVLKTVKQVDHKNRFIFDNRKSNLRIASTFQNSCNYIRQKPKGKNKFRGICWCKRDKKWGATIRYGFGRMSLGRFDFDWEAALAYDEKARELHKEFAILNYIVT